MDAVDIIGRIGDDDATIPDIRELLGYINSAFGGSRQYARMVANDVEAAPEGSSQRLTFHNNFISAVAKFGGNEDLAGADEEALEAERKRLIAELKEADGNA